MRTVINFVVDTHSLPAPGTFKQPAWTNHFPAVVSRDGGASINYPANQTVRAGLGDEIIITLQDSSLGLYVELAPVMILAHAWGPDENSLSALDLDTITNAEKKPIDRPNFDVNQVNLPKMGFTGDETDWQPVQASDNLCWKDGVKIMQNTSVSLATLYGPYVTFKFQSMPGVLEYGVEFAVSTDGKSIGYYYFDPRIQVG